MKIQSLAMLALVLLIGACKNNAKETGYNAAISVRSVDKLPAGFMPFYEQFHSDSLYQIAHISWPLAGEQSATSDMDASTKLVSTVWQQEDWHMQHLVDFSKGAYQREFQAMGDILVLEKITTAVGGYSLERHFACDDKGDWALVYYIAMH